MSETSFNVSPGGLLTVPQQLLLLSHYPASLNSLSLRPGLFKQHFLYRIWQDYNMPEAVVAYC